MENIELLVRELTKLPQEAPWVEFKWNNDNPYMIGKAISALSNSAALKEKSFAYLVWGIDDETHEVLGTTFDYRTAKKGNEELENWLRHQLSKNADFEFDIDTVDGKSIILLRIWPATDTTVMFEKIDYIKITKKLNEYPEVKARLWDRLRKADFEMQIAMPDLTVNQIFEILSFQIYFDLTGTVMPTEPDAIMQYLLRDDIVTKQENGLYAITNLGALLFAKRLRDFPTVSRKALRIAEFEGISKMNIIRQRDAERGYAVEFDELVKWIEALLPEEEIIEGALRKKIVMYPDTLIRECMANAIIHQDLTSTGNSATVEIFDNRIEIVNPGVPLVDINHFIDNPPKSRNNKLAGIMRRMHLCEELGTGWDKIIISAESAQLPAPKIIISGESTVVLIHEKMLFNELSKEDKIRACYQHAVLRYVQRIPMTNSSLRERFGLEKTMTAKVSRLIREAVDTGVIKPKNTETNKKLMSYIPEWA